MMSDQPIWAWFLRNLAFPLAMVVATSTVCAGIQVREIDGGSYRTLRQCFKSGSAEFRKAVADAMQNGEITRWELGPLLRQYMDEKHALVVETGATNLKEERLRLAALTRQLRDAQR